MLREVFGQCSNLYLSAFLRVLSKSGYSERISATKLTGSLVRSTVFEGALTDIYAYRSISKDLSQLE